MPHNAAQVYNGLIRSVVVFFSSFYESGEEVLELKKIKWPNKSFKTNGRPNFFEFQHFPAGYKILSLGENGINEHTGFFQLHIAVEDNTGDKFIRDWHSKLDDFYTTEKIFEYEDFQIIFEKSHLTDGRNIDGFFVETWVVEYRTKLIRK